MTARPGTVQGDRIWQRCPFCGDSPTSPNKAHFFVSLSTLSYHCYRCGESGILPLKAILRLVNNPEFISQLSRRSATAIALKDPRSSEAKSKFELLQEQLLSGPGTARASGLRRLHVIRHGKLYDAFEQRDPVGIVLGYNLRRGKDETKEAYSLGSRGLGYIGETLRAIVGPILLVEGPYDVLGPARVCVYGLYPMTILKMLKGKIIVVVPDGDVWNRPELLWRIHKNIKRAKINVVGFIELPEHLDPGDVSVLGDKEVMSYGKFLSRLNPSSTW